LLGVIRRPAAIKQVVDGSLYPFGVDVVDLYDEHRVDPQVPSAGAAAHVQGAHEGRQGKALRLLSRGSTAGDIRC
jgi:aryl-alcohol dehydrogenase-like predicted oxidoreductase